MQMPIHSVHWLLDLFDELGITVWIDGGWGVDALLGKQTRDHEDLDIIIGWEDTERLTDALLEKGFSHVYDDDRKDRNYVMRHLSHGLIDFHVISFSGNGGAIYGPGEVDEMISKSELNSTGSIGGRTVRCLSAEYQVRSHSGYELHPCDFADMAALNQNSGSPCWMNRPRVTKSSPWAIYFPCNRVAAPPSGSRGGTVRRRIDS